MTRRVKLNELDAMLSEYEFPTDRDALADTCADVELVLAEGEADFSGLLRACDTDSFDSPEDVRTEIMNRLPRNAVGEPFQSEGDG